MKSKMRAGAVLSYTNVAFNALSGLLYTPWMISRIGADDYALYTLAISVVNFFLFDFGLSTAVSRFLSSYYTDGREDDARRFLGIVYKLYIGISFVILCLLIVIYLNIDVIYATLGAEQLDKFRTIYLVVVGYSVISFPCLVFNGVLTSKEEFLELNLCNLLQKVTCVGLVILSLLMDLGVLALVLANAVSSILFSLVKYIIVRTRTSARANMAYWDSGLFREIFSFSSWVLITDVAGRLIFSIAPSLLAVCSTSWEITVFGLASSLEGYVYTVANALGSMFMPSVTRVLHLQGGGTSLQDLLVRYGRIQLYIVGLLIVGFFVLGNRFVDCWMGEDYVSVYWSACLLIIPSLFSLPQMAADTALTAAGEVKGRCLAYVLMAAVNAVLMSPLSSLWGSVGACTSVMVAYLVRTIALNLIYKRRLGIDPVSFYVQTFSDWIFPTAVVSLVMWSASFICSSQGWFALGVLVLIFCVIYTFAMLRFSFNDYERGLFGSALKKLKRKNGE